MKRLRDFFKKAEPQKPDMEDILSIAKNMGPMLDKISNDIFMAHQELLMSNPATFIIPGIWGASKKSDLTPEQIKINEMVLPVIEDAVRSFGIQNINDRQKFALGYLIRGFIINKILYMIEALKNKSHQYSNQNKEDDKDKEESYNILLKGEPIGSA